ncbi:MAG TPA: hypothetical protein VE955_07550 [Candidatus Dormibacteraeota bacterium]|nr:hypothetical protein [Candidatus Dormibacteraeota bacterium]
MTLLSVQLPWIVYGTIPVLIRSDGVYSVVFYWLLAGAVLSYLSRFGGAMTLVGMVAFAGEGYNSFGLVRPDLGLLLALGGALFTFMGVRWAVPPWLMRRREVLGGLLYSVGFLITLTLVFGAVAYGGLFYGGSSQLIMSAPLLIVGVLMTGLGLKLFLSPVDKETTLGQI